MASLAQNFLSEVEAFLARTKMSASAFGHGAVNDPNFVSDLREGRTPSLRLADRVHEFMRSHEENAA
jgi:hypothetical protein